VSNVTDEITAHLMNAVKLAVAAEGNRAGEYAPIVQADVDADGSVILDWQRYGPCAAADVKEGEQQ
jgi:hypothetical protein